MIPDLFDPRQPEDVDLVEQCRNVLFKKGLGKEAETAFDTNTDIITAKTLRPEGQRYFLNRFWGLQLMSLTELKGVNTMNERWCLVPTGEIKDWLRLFEDSVTPTLVAHQLPAVLS